MNPILVHAPVIFADTDSHGSPVLLLEPVCCEYEHGRMVHMIGEPSSGSMGFSLAAVTCPRCIRAYRTTAPE